MPNNGTYPQNFDGVISAILGSTNAGRYSQNYDGIISAILGSANAGRYPQNWDGIISAKLGSANAGRFEQNYNGLICAWLGYSYSQVQSLYPPNMDGWIGCIIDNGINPIVSTYNTNVIGQSSTLSTTQRNALSAFVTGCQSDGIWSLLLEVYPLMGSSLAGAAVKLKDAVSQPVMTNTNFVSGDYNETNGLTSGASKYWTTGFKNNNWSSITDQGLGVFLDTLNNQNGVMGNQDTLIFHTGGTLYIAGSATMALATPGRGFYTTNFLPSSTGNAYKNGD